MQRARFLFFRMAQIITMRLNSESDRFQTFSKNEQMDPIDLICIKVGSKLRVRITSPGYLKDANCQFPRDLRAEGLRYKVNPMYVTLVKSRGKHFYSIPAGVAWIVDNTDVGTKLPTKVFEDPDMDLCAICLERPKESVFAPCGHY